MPKYIDKNWIERNPRIRQYYKAEQLHHTTFHIAETWPAERGAWKLHKQEKLKHIWKKTAPRLLWRRSICLSNAKTFFTTGDQTKFYCQSLLRPTDFEPLRCSEAVRCWKQILQLARISLKSSAHQPEPAPGRTVLLRLLPRRSWQLLSALAPRAVLLEEKENSALTWETVTFQGQITHK